MDSLLNSAMETFEALPLGPMELVVLAAVMTVSLCYLFSKGNAPSRQEVNTSTRSINNAANACKQQQRGMDSHDSTEPMVVQQAKSVQAHLNPMNTAAAAASSASNDDDDEQEDKGVPDFLSDASSTTTDSDTTAVGMIEQLPSKEHVDMDDNADLVDDEQETTTRNMDVKMDEPTTTDSASQNNKSQAMDHEKGADECTHQSIDRHATTIITTTAAAALITDDDDDNQVAILDSSSMDPTTETQQTALQSVTENLDGAETDGQLDMKNTNDMCNPAVIAQPGATKDNATDDGVGEQDQSRTATGDMDAPTPIVDEDKAADLVMETTQHGNAEEETSIDSAPQRLNDGATSEDDHQPILATEAIPVVEGSPETHYDATPTTTTEPSDDKLTAAATLVENSGDVASPSEPCDQDLNTAAAAVAVALVENEKEEEVMMTRPVVIGVDTEKEQQQPVMVMDDDDKSNNGECLEVDDLACQKASITEELVEPVAQVAQDGEETNTAQLGSVGQDTSDDTTTTRQVDGQCTMADTTQDAFVTTAEHDLPQTNTTTTTTVTDDNNLAASTNYEVLNGPHPASMMTNPTNKPKQDMSRIERIGQQRQPYIPLYKSRCTFWPGCTNNHCKYYHPFIECRNGKSCEFGKKCVFLHPKDYNDYQKHASRKNKTKTKSNGKQQQNMDTCHQDQVKIEQQS